MHLGLNWAYIRKPYEKSSIYGHLEFFFFFLNNYSFLTKLKFFVRKKIGDMHVLRGGGGGELHRSLHGPKSKLLVFCLLQKALSVCGEN